MNHYDEEKSFDKGLKSLDNKHRITEEEQASILNVINRRIDNNIRKQKSSKWKYYIASAATIFILLILAIPLLSNTFDNIASGDVLSGKTFNLSDPPFYQNDSPYKRISLKFSSDNIVTNPIYGAGTYELNDNVLVLSFKNENESIKIQFTNFMESDLEYSDFSAIFSDMEYQITDDKKVSHLKNLQFEFMRDMTIQFIEVD